MASLCDRPPVESMELSVCGLPRRAISKEQRLITNIRAWFSMAPCIFRWAIVSRGYATEQEIVDMNPGMTIEELKTEMKEGARMENPLAIKITADLDHFYEPSVSELLQNALPGETQLLWQIGSRPIDEDGEQEWIIAPEALSFGIEREMAKWHKAG